MNFVDTVPAGRDEISCQTYEQLSDESWQQDAVDGVVGPYSQRSHLDLVLERVKELPRPRPCFGRRAAPRPRPCLLVEVRQKQPSRPSTTSSKRRRSAASSSMAASLVWYSYRTSTRGLLILNRFGSFLPPSRLFWMAARLRQEALRLAATRGEVFALQLLGKEVVVEARRELSLRARRRRRPRAPRRSRRTTRTLYRPTCSASST